MFQANANVSKAMKQSQNPTNESEEIQKVNTFKETVSFHQLTTSDFSGEKKKKKIAEHCK